MNWNLTVDVSPEIVGDLSPEQFASRLDEAIDDQYVVTPVGAFTYSIELVDVEEEDVEHRKDLVHQRLLYHFDPDTDSMIVVEINYD